MMKILIKIYTLSTFFIDFRRKSERKLADTASLWSSGPLAKTDVGFI